MIEIMECINDAMLEETAALAAKIWHEYFSSLLTPDQIDYMVEKFQTTMIEIMECINDAMLEETAALAAKIWHEYFSSLLTPDQIDYMVEKFQSREAMKRQVETEQYGYWQVRQDGTLIGYIGLQFQKDRLFLSKLYLRQESRGQGIASRMLAKVYDTAREFGYDRLWLTCNKHNRHSLDVYAAKGFVCIGEDVTDIGQGYVMDDYFLEKTL